jgi:Carboxypeptidase regulatory-like domain
MHRNRIALLLCLVIPASVCAQSSPTQDARPENKQETCTISGVVLRASDGGPLKDATVWFADGGNHDGTIATTTDSGGLFELRNVPAGQYTIEVLRAGYIDAKYGQKKPGDPGAKLTLRPGQKLVDLVFKLERSGVIAGHVFNEEGEPMQRVQVSALRKVVYQGKNEFLPTEEGMSNDLGEFRLYGLMPGRYVVTAEPEVFNRIVGSPQFSEANQGAEGKSYVKLYYPGGMSAKSASVIPVKSDGEIVSIDIFMKKIAGYNISGKVVSLLPKTAMSRSIELDALRATADGSWEEIGARASRSNDGSFEFMDVPSGSYSIRALSVSEDGAFHSSQLDVSVASADVEGLILTIDRGVSIPGQIIWEGTPKRVGNELLVTAHSSENSPFMGARAYVDENNQFTLKGAPEGELRVGLWGIAPDYYVKQLRYGGNIMTDGILRVAKDSTGRLDVVVSSRAAHLQGTVQNEDNLPAVGAWVVAIPGKKTSRDSYSTNTDQNGHFEFPGLPPGRYKLYSWEGIEEGVWEDPEFLKDYQSKSTDLEVNEGDKKSVELKLIRAIESETASD